MCSSVIPAKAGIQGRITSINGSTWRWTPAFAGVTAFHWNFTRVSFSLALLQALEFNPQVDGKNTAFPRALRTLREMNASGRRKVAADTAIDFAPPRLQAIIEGNGQIERSAWECALLLKLRDEIKSGNLSVRYSRRFEKLDDFFIDDGHWQSLRSDFFQRAGLPSDPSELPAYLDRRLGETYDRFLQTAPTNSYAVADEKGWHLSADTTEKLNPEAKERLSTLEDWLSKRMRRIRLPELLIEVDNDLRLTRHFMTPAQRQEPAAEDICAVLAAVMAHGCDIGSYTSSKSTTPAPRATPRSTLRPLRCSACGSVRASAASSTSASTASTPPAITGHSRAWWGAPTGPSTPLQSDRLAQRRALPPVHPRSEAGQAAKRSPGGWFLAYEITPICLVPFFWPS